MTRNKNPLFILSSAAMELCWMSAWAIFSMLLTSGHVFPIPMALFTFILSANIMSHASKSGKSPLLTAAVQVFSFFMATAVMLWVPPRWTLGFFQNQWIISLLTHSKTYIHWFGIVFIFVWIALFWAAGATWAIRSGSHQTTCNRFDLGAALLFGLFLIKLIVLKRFGVKIETSSIINLSGSFFLFGLLAIGCAKNQAGDPREFFGAFRGVGILLSFSVVIFLFSLGSISFLGPYYQTAARISYGYLKEMANPLWMGLVELLIWLFKPNQKMIEMLRDMTSAGSNRDVDLSLSASRHGAALEGIGIFYGIVVFILVVFCFYHLLRWLFADKKQSEEGKIFSAFGWVIRLISTAAALLADQYYKARRPKNSTYFYAALLRWGKHSGVPHIRHETPNEYALRLIQRFPALKEEINSIIGHFNEHAYGGVDMGVKRISRIHAAWRKLKNPALWPARLKARLKA